MDINFTPVIRNAIVVLEGPFFRNLHFFFRVRLPPPWPPPTCLAAVFLLRSRMINDVSSSGSTSAVAAAACFSCRIAGYCWSQHVDVRDNKLPTVSLITMRTSIGK